ncbi:hypothetical protein CROQUDRAFT_655762, partial [Cronartium quercuum f. sp. fusiforme G11]
PQRIQSCRHPPLLHLNVPNPTSFRRNTMPRYSADIKVQAIILLREGLTRAAVKRHLRSMEFIPLLFCKSVKGYPTRHENVDFAIIRENTKGEYSGLEHTSVPGVIESLKIMTRNKCERIARVAFDFALKTQPFHLQSLESFSPGRQPRPYGRPPSAT